MYTIHTYTYCPKRCKMGSCVSGNLTPKKPSLLPSYLIKNIYQIALTNMYIVYSSHIIWSNINVRKYMIYFLNFFKWQFSINCPDTQLLRTHIVWVYMYMKDSTTANYTNLIKIHGINIQVWWEGTTGSWCNC